MGRKPRLTGPARIERQRRTAAILSMRMDGWSLQAIGEAQDPLASSQEIFKTIKKALAEVVSDEVDEARKIELLRLDELLAGVYERAINGDIAAIDRVLAISHRRIRLLGLDYFATQAAASRPDGDDDDWRDGRDVRVEIVSAETPGWPN
jgi:hypothetical protein